MNDDELPTVDIGEFVSMQTLDLAETGEFLIQLRGPNRFRKLVAHKIFHTAFSIAEVDYFLEHGNIEGEG